MSRTLIVLTAAPLFVAGCNHAPPAGGGVERGETLLTVSGTGHAESRPDQAIFTAGLENSGASAGAAMANANAAVQRIVAALKTDGVTEKDMQTSSISIERIEYGRNRGQFHASNTVTVKVRQVDKAGAAIAAATQAGANVLSGPSLTVSDPEAASLYAHGLAYKAARAKADAYAKAAGMHVSRVIEIIDGGEGGSMPMMQAEEMREKANDAARPMTPAPVMVGTNSNTITARVDFALRPD